MFFQNLIENLFMPIVILYLLTGDLNQNVYSGKVSNANHGFNVTTVRN